MSINPLSTQNIVVGAAADSKTSDRKHRYIMFEWLDDCLRDCLNGSQTNSRNSSLLSENDLVIFE